MAFSFPALIVAVLTLFANCYCTAHATIVFSISYVFLSKKILCNMLFFSIDYVALLLIGGSSTIVVLAKIL